MKYLIILWVVLLSCLSGHAQPAPEAIWDRANTAYINSDFDGAIHGYDSIVQAGYSSYKLYYNLGNAYFKAGQIGESILNYHRALRLAPSDADVKHNLLVANSFVKDNIEKVPEFFLKTWLHNLRLSVSSNTWAIISLIALTGAMAAMLIYLLAGRISWRKSGFYTAIIALVVFFVSMGFSIKERRELLHSSEAVVMSSAAPVKSSPDNSSKDIFVLHEGTKVKVLGSLDQWREIAIPDGNKGWILVSAIETI